MKNYAYLDKGNILHVVENEETAEEYSKTGKVVETEITGTGGYPLVGKEGIIVYAENNMRFATDKPKIKDADKVYPHLAALYTACRG